MSDHRPILLIRVGALGDQVLFSAVVAALAEHQGQPVDVVTNGGFADQALIGMPGLGRLFAAPHRRRPAWLAPDLLLLARTLARRGYADAYVFDRLPIIERALAAAGTRVHTALESAETHCLDHFTTVLTDLGVALQQPLLPRVVVQPTDRRAAHELLRRHGIADRPLIAIQPGNSRTLHPFHQLRPQRNLKSWPSASWSATLSRLAEQHPEAVFALLGASSERSVCQEVQSGLPAALRQRVTNLAGELPIRTLIGLLDGAHGCLSVDTGPAHLAAAVGCPLVVLFGPADPRAMAPRGPAMVRTVVSGVACSPCYGTPARAACRDNVCMRTLSVDAVLAAWEELEAARTGMLVSA